MIQILPLIIVTAAVLLAHAPSIRQASDKISSYARAWSNAIVAGVGTMALTTSITTIGVSHTLQLLLPLLLIPTAILMVHGVLSYSVLGRTFTATRPLTLVLIVCATAGNLLAFFSFEQYLAAIPLVLSGTLVQVVRNAFLRGRAVSVTHHAAPPSAGAGYL